MEDLYVIEQGCTLKKLDQQILITKGGMKIDSIPIFKIDKILLFGNQQITSQALNLAFEYGVDVLFLSYTGKLKGKLSSINSKNIYLKLSQYETWKDKQKRLDISRKIVKAKIWNQYMLLKKYNISEMSLLEQMKKIDIVNDIENIMGYEGAASKIYFDKFKILIPNNFVFDGRNRRPPKDEVNALLSLTYTLLLNKIISEVDKNGLEGNIGFLHSIKYGRESLALDLLEPFRQYFCDAFVLKLLRRKELVKEDFESRDDGIFLTELAFRKYINKFKTESSKIDEDIREQVIQIKKHILGEGDYKPMMRK
ncbi:CRISPR-associated endonuclease Cas1 [Thermobrachium celere]|uniref:CRISPR-associated endonuclease Cas1 n=1 Tax=Thermobrachium celere TaxID=53422 RepID=UPI001941CD3B|nr:CRISPR-associated endonuclease Cas1 [Thermobrachium celere]GFR36589.1 CRISPR-associated endonuclease Cas1 [Thermobrachium celere]